MRRVLLFLLLSALVIAAAFAIAAIPGSIGGDVGSLHFDAPNSIAFALLLALFAVLYALARLLAAIFGVPSRLNARSESRRGRAGERALTGALLALAAGEAGDARREATRARRLLGATPQTLLVSAEADRVAGRLAEAETGYEALAARRDTAYLGLRGLTRLSIERNDFNRARELVDRADRARPDSRWVKTERLVLAVRMNDWPTALSLARDDVERAAFATAAAAAEPDHHRALKFGKQAHKLAPALAPASLVYANCLRQDWNESRALAVLRETFNRAPHPALAEAAVTDQSDPLQRVKVASSFTAKQPDHGESHLLMARVSMQAGMIGEARRHAEAARTAMGNQRRILALLADIAERDPALSEAERRSAHTEALRALAVGLPDPTWRCRNCTTAHVAWSAVCPSCSSAGRLDWTMGPSTALTLAAPPAPALLG